MKNRHKSQKKAGGGNIVAAAKRAAESKSDTFKAGGKAGGLASGGKAALRADKAPRKRAMGGSLSSAARLDSASNGGPGAGHEDA